MNQISIEEISRKLRHGTIQFTKMWCRDNHVDIHICETTGKPFAYSCQYESAITKKRFSTLQKSYGKSWEQEWQSAMKEYMKRYMGPIMLN